MKSGMQPAQAVALMRQGVGELSRATVWLDLGAGKGLFSNALSQVLLPGSVIYAVDRVAVDWQSATSVTINWLVQDFVTQLSSLPQADGILMANSLHYVKDQSTFLTSLYTHLHPGGQMLVLDYNMDRANTWVPYPVSFARLQNVVSSTPFQKPVMLASVASVYHPEGMYLARLSR